VRVLILHNAYRFPGGEERAVAADRNLLVANGHEARVYERSYDEITERDLAGRARLGFEVFWSPATYRQVRNSIRNWRPDIAHIHNVFPLISPSAYAACRAEGVPTVQTLHNYRLVCAASTLLRDGLPCELCVGRVPWPAVRYACYRGSRVQSIAMAGSIAAHSFAGTWRNDVDAYIALTDFARRIFVRGGLPANRLFVRPNSVDVPPPESYVGPRSAVFIGRLSQEKGIAVLLEAWRKLDLPLTIVGDGPLLSYVRSYAASHDMRHVEIAGRLPHAEALERLRGSGMLVFPSICYEGLPYALLEALSAGIPVIAADLGSQAEIVADGTNGLLFERGSAVALAAAVRKLVDSPRLAERLARGARRVFEERYSPEQSFARLMEVYRFVGVSV
jgi:glycosyltransferase involved in cell wall biosynthesis